MAELQEALKAFHWRSSSSMKDYEVPLLNYSISDVILSTDQAHHTTNKWVCESPVCI